MRSGTLCRVASVSACQSDHFSWITAHNRYVLQHISDTLDANRICKMRSMIDLEFQSHVRMPEAGCFFELDAGWIRSFHIRLRLPRPAYMDFPRYCA